MYEKDVRKIKITFLGTGAATAMPLPFCKCETCRYARAFKGKDIRKRAAVMINGALLIDLGPDVPNACIQYDQDLANIKYILQTHAHSDHFDAGHLMTRHKDYAVEGIEEIILMASHGTFMVMDEALRKEDASINLLDKNSQSALSLTLETIANQEEKLIGDYKVTAFDAQHGSSQEALVYLIEYQGKSVLYGTDLLEVSEAMYTALEDITLDMIILDQTYGEGYNAGGHLDAGKIKTIIKRMKRLGIVNEQTLIYATHISHEGNDIHVVMEAQADQAGYHIAYDGCVVEL